MKLVLEKLLNWISGNGDSPDSAVRRLDQLDGEEELNCADEKAAEVEWQRDGAQRERHLIQNDVLGRRQELELILGRLLIGGRRNFKEKNERQKCKEEWHETQKS